MPLKIHCLTSVIRTPWGYIGLAAAKDGLVHIVLPRKTAGAVRRELEKSLGENGGAPENKTAAAAARKILDKAAAQISEYLAGKRRSFSVPLAPQGATSFTREVWRACSEIPFGQTRSYGWIAGRIGRPKAARAVGNALGANPLPLMAPCHRVIAGDGSLGGYGGGLEMKRNLLALESPKR